MTYATRDELISRFGQQEIDDLIDRNLDDAEDTGALNTALADSDAIIDGFLAGKYTVPIIPSPAVIVAVACDIARYKLWDDRAPDEVRKRFEDAMKMLRDISNGIMTLPGAAAAPTSQSSGIDYTAPDRIFTACTLKGF